MQLTSEESNFRAKYQLLKQSSGLHSPSVYDISRSFSQIEVRIDACFLCNPYAFDLSFEWIKKIDIQAALKHYPPQNLQIVEYISSFRNLDADRLVVGNGAIEIIENLFGCIEGKKILIPIPSFSSYYELASLKNEVHFFQLDKREEFKLIIEDFICHAQLVCPDIIVLINPSNPSGQFLSVADIIEIHEQLNEKQTLIIDESFIDFAPEYESIEQYAKGYTNIIVIRSLSKDFGIAGLRLGYAFLPVEIRNHLYKRAFLWNINGIAYSFCKFLAEPEFIQEYHKVKRIYREVRSVFFDLLVSIPNIRVYPSEANFFLIETLFDAELLFIKLLVNHGIYIRVLNDKEGLKGNFVRIACKDSEENIQIFNAICTEAGIISGVSETFNLLTS
jgi:threonine-phosphate decarboxylase